MGNCFRNINVEEDESEKEYLFTPKSNFYEGKRNCTYYYDNGDIYEGDWVNDEKHGEGTYHFVSGKV